MKPEHAFWHIALIVYCLGAGAAYHFYFEKGNWSTWESAYFVWITVSSALGFQGTRYYSSA